MSPDAFYSNFDIETAIKVLGEIGIDCLLESAEMGDERSQCMLGTLYIFGIGVWKDAEAAVKWYRRAANNQNAEAHYNLGNCYKSGVGVEKSQETAFYHYMNAAINGDDRGLFAIKFMGEPSQYAQKELIECGKELEESLRKYIRFKDFLKPIADGEYDNHLPF